MSKIVKPLPLASLENITNWLKLHLPNISEHVERRGYQLLEWEPVRPNSQQKPIQLSIEHEARLCPRTKGGLKELQNMLYENEGKSFREGLLGSNGHCAELIIRRYQRSSGAQSIDHYYDTKELSLTTSKLTVRERVKTSNFMTWRATDDDNRALNMELPFVNISDSGVTTRMEFNWIDVFEKSWDEAFSAGTPQLQKFTNPFYITAQQFPFIGKKVSPLIEHTTFREKFGFFQKHPSEVNEVFVLNIDHVITQSLLDNRIAQYIDVDISAPRQADTELLDKLIAFTELMSKLYELEPNTYTKAHRDAFELNMI